METSEYNRLIGVAFSEIESAFDAFDPDIVEADRVGDTLQIVFGDGMKFIISTQSSVHQIWLAGAARGWHFSYEGEQGTWVSAKNGDELYQSLEMLVSEQLGTGFRIDGAAQV